MSNRVLVLIGTRKGAFILEGGADRKSWELKGPFCATWPINHVVGDPATGTIYGAGGNQWFGPAIWKSTDLAGGGHERQKVNCPLRQASLRQT